jgi:hypothetical protein
MEINCLQWPLSQLLYVIFNVCVCDVGGGICLLIEFCHVSVREGPGCDDADFLFDMHCRFNMWVVA